jgi:L-lactate dehydrogenase (cytochrome)
MRDREFVGRLIDRARRAGCSALMVTLDLQLAGQRHKDIKNGLSAPPRLTVPNLLNMATRPRWCLDMLRTPRRTFGNIIGHVAGVDNIRSLAAWTAEQFDPTLGWGDLAWIRERWGGKLIVKGVMDAEDARHAVEAGVDALVVSNHGGRQLDGAPSTISVLPDILRAVDGRTEVWMDGGIRSGQDVLRALALGARGVLIGRAFLYGLGACGERGVHRTLDIIARELDLSMAFCGRTRVQDVDRTILANPGLY